MKELNIKCVSLEEGLKNWEKERNSGKYDIDKFSLNLKIVNNNAIYINNDLNTDKILDE